MLGIVARAAANVAPDEEAEADVHGAWAKNIPRLRKDGPMSYLL